MLSPSELNRELVKRYRFWLYEMKYSNLVVQRYPRIAGEFCDLLGNRKIETTTSWDVRTFLVRTSNQKRLGYGAIYITLAALRNFFDFLSLGGVTASLPVRAVRLRPPRRSPPPVASPGTILRLISAAKRPRDAAIVELLYATGCRAAELVKIKVEDVDFESRKIRVTGKLNKSRYVVFGSHAARALRTYLRGRKSGYLFQSATLQQGCIYKHFKDDRWIGEVGVYTDEEPLVRRRVVFRLGLKSKLSRREAWRRFRQKIRGLNIVRPMDRPMATNTLRKIIDTLSIRAGIERITPHQIRHCFATHMLEGGANIREIQELLGHSCLTTTEVYTHVERKRMLDRFDKCHPRGNKYRVARGS